MNTRICIILCMLLLSACSGYTPDGRLSRVAGMVSESPGDALSALDSIDRGSLSEADRHYHDFLSIKANDKVYNHHISDSLILDVIDYYSSHKSTGLYPEALYFGGRVYSDLGDYPTAIFYYQKSLDYINEDDMASLHLKGNVTSQLGRQLNGLRLYSQAIPYLEAAIHIDSILCDTFSLAYDNQLLGAIYFHQDSLDIATGYFRIAKTWARYLTEKKDVSYIQMYEAAVALKKGEVSSAVSLIRDIPYKVNHRQRNIALAYSSDIYKAAGKYDSAYIFADSLIHSPDDNNLRSGYSNMFSSELFSFIPSDSVMHYIAEYDSILEAYYDRHESQQALMQHSLYNYRIHEREKNKALEARRQLISWLVISIFLVLIIAIVFLSHRIKTRHTIIRLHDIIAKLEAIQQKKENPAQPINVVPSSRESLRERLKQKINQLDSATPTEPLPSDFVDSDSYKTLLKYVKEKTFISDSDPLWGELYELILQNYPLFETNLHLLIGDNIKPHELQTIILIKCGITPTQMTYLLGKAKGSISSRRVSLSTRILGEKTNQKFVDILIRSLK